MCITRRATFYYSTDPDATNWICMYFGMMTLAVSRSWYSVPHGRHTNGKPLYGWAVVVEAVTVLPLRRKKEKYYMYLYINMPVLNTYKNSKPITALSVQHDASTPTRLWIFHRAKRYFTFDEQNAVWIIHFSDGKRNDEQHFPSS